MEYLEQLVNLAYSRKQWLSLHKLSKYAADGPDVDGGRVVALTEQDLRGTVPQRDDLTIRCGEAWRDRMEGSGQHSIHKMPYSIAYSLTSVVYWRGGCTSTLTRAKSASLTVQLSRGFMPGPGMIRRCFGFRLRCIIQRSWQ